MKLKILLIIFILTNLMIILSVNAINDVPRWKYVGQTNIEGNKQLEVNEQKLYAGTDGGRVYRLYGNIDNPKWRNLGQLCTGAISAMQSYNNILYAVCQGVVYEKRGSSWVNIGAPGGVGVKIFSTAVHQNKLYVGSYNGNVYRYNGLNSWSYVGNPGGSGFELWVLSLESHNGKLYAGKIAGPTQKAKGEVYEYQGGAEWAFAGIPDEENNYNDVTDLESYNNELYAISSYGVISKRISGTKWLPITDLDEEGFCELEESNGKLYAGFINIFKYNQSQNFWTNLGNPVYGGYALTTLKDYENHLFVTGQFGYQGKVFASLN